MRFFVFCGVVCLWERAICALLSGEKYVFQVRSPGGSRFWTADSLAVIQALGREGVLPFSRFWASNRPFNSPAAGLLQHYLLCVFVMLVPPPGDAYNFLLKYDVDVDFLTISNG